MSPLLHRLKSIVSAGFVCLIAASVSTLHAQARRGTLSLQAGAALAAARTSVAGETSTDAGPLLTGQLGVALSPRTDLTAGLVVQPYKAHNPARAGEFIRCIRLLGDGARRRSGNRPGVACGCEAGRPFEGFGILSGADELSTMFGFGVSVVPAGARPRGR